MQVIGSGFGRTGTLSTKHALETLGFTKCHHMEEVMRAPRSQLPHWSAAAEGRPVDWHAAFDGFEACVDFPASTRWKEIAAAFPDAKILHTVRDPERWYDSTYETIYQARTLLPRWMRDHTPMGRTFDMIDALVWNGVLEGSMDDRTRAIEVFEAWTADVVASVPADRLLVFEVAQGWEPLCDFLGVPVPDVGFPRVNDRESMLRRFATVRFATRAVPGALAAAATAGVVRAVRRR